MSLNGRRRPITPWAYIYKLGEKFNENWKLISAAMTAMLLTSGLALPAVAGNSSGKASPPASGEGIYVLGSPSDETSNGAEFYAIPDQYRNALVITPDVAADLHLPPGPVPASEVQQVSNKVASVQVTTGKGTSKSPDGRVVAMDANTTSFTYGPGTSWYGPYQRNTSLSGCCHKYYSWAVDPNLSTQACLLGQGWYTGYNGGSFGLWSEWYSLGCGKSGGAQVPWDNVSAYPKVMAKSQYGYYGGGTFS